MKKMYIIIMMYFLGLVQSCCTNKGDTLYYEFTGFMIKPLSYKANDGYIQYQFNNSTSFYADSFGFLIDLKYIDRYAWNFSISFESSIYADALFQCPEHYYEPNKKIKGIQILTLKKFDENHLENSDVTEYFDSYYGTGYTCEKISKTGLLERINQRQSYPREQEISDPVLVLTHKSTNDSIQFEIVITRDDDRKLSSKTIAMKVLK